MSYEGDDRHAKRLVAEWGVDQCVPASSQLTKELEDKVELGPKLEYKVGMAVARIKLNVFGQTGYHPGITNSVKVLVEACERNKRCFDPHDQIHARRSKMCQHFQSGKREDNRQLYVFCDCESERASNVTTDVLTEPVNEGASISPCCA